MDTRFQCPSCGRAIARNAPRGICPHCLLQGAFPSNGGGGEGFVAPAAEELAKRFPGLEIIECIGQGGMGAVYKARQKDLDRFVALKILPETRQGDPAFALRFAHEARALAQLNHPHIVTLYEFGQSEGLFYFLMEYVDGLNLQSLLQSGRLAPQQALAIVPQICEALQFAHSRGIIHRDIKPGNLLLTRTGEIKIADFGVAKIIASNTEAPAESSIFATNSGLTVTGNVMGTPAYMAPEQKNRPLGVDHRADIYSLGVVFYQMLTGELPTEEFVPPSRKAAVDARLDEVVSRALEREPSRRYVDATAFKSEIEAIVRDAISKPIARNRRLLKAVVVAFCSLSALVALNFVFRVNAARRAASSLTLVDTSPPVVVETTPVSGDTNVEPGLREIRVRFSKEMTDGAWSWSSAWDNSMPSTVTEPHYQPDGRTCVETVRLEPGRSYALWINSAKFKEFADAEGRPAIPYLLIFQTRAPTRNR